MDWYAKKIKDEVLELKKKFPGLYRDRGFLRGEINVSAVYDRQNDKLIHYPDEENIKKYKNTFFEDVYEIKIDLNTRKVFEIGNKIEKTADNHINDSDASCCLGLFKNSNPNNLLDYVMNYVLPFFAWQASKSKYNKTPPWGEYSHGEKGLKEFMKENGIEKFGRNDKCYCGSGKKHKRCCLNKNYDF